MKIGDYTLKASKHRRCIILVMYKVQLISGKNIQDFVNIINQWLTHNKTIKIIDIHYVDSTSAYILYEDLDDGNFN